MWPGSSCLRFDTLIEQEQTFEQFPNKASTMQPNWEYHAVDAVVSSV